MKILIYIVPVLFLSACIHSQQEVVIEAPQIPAVLEPVVAKEDCTHFPYDDSNSACNLLGWMTYAQQALMHTKQAHREALMFKTDIYGVEHKRLILLTSHFESTQTRTQAMKAMFKLAGSHENSFGHFFQMLATYTENELIKSKEAIHLQAKLKKMHTSNVELKNQLADAQSKIEAIMDIEKNLKAN